MKNDKVVQQLLAWCFLFTYNQGEKVIPRQSHDDVTWYNYQKFVFL